MIQHQKTAPFVAEENSGRIIDGIILYLSRQRSKVRRVKRSCKTQQPASPLRLERGARLLSRYTDSSKAIIPEAT